MTDQREESSTDLEQALAAYLAAQRMTRRQLLERIAAVGAAAALAPVIAACSAGTVSDPGRAAEPEAATDSVVPSLPIAPLPAAPVPAAAAASSHVISRIIARLVTRG